MGSRADWGSGGQLRGVKFAKPCTRVGHLHVTTRPEPVPRLGNPQMVGSAVDGVYYVMGLRRLEAHLFGVSWRWGRRPGGGGQGAEGRP